MVMTKPKVDKVDQDKGSEVVSISTDNDSLSWIPVSGNGLDNKEKKTTQKLTATLQIKYICTKLDNFSRLVTYFNCVNPEALRVVKDDIENQGLNPETTNLPFWQGSEGDVMLRVGRQNCSIADEDLKSDGSIMTRQCEFKYYTGKKMNGYSIHM